MNERIRNADGGIGAGLRICMVEDDEDLREELVLGLGDFGFCVRGFPGSRELYRDLLHTPCDVVVVDIGLPGEDGFSITSSLRHICDVGIVLLTSRTAVEDRVRALMDGADAYLVKPVDLRELAATLVSVHRRAARSAAVPEPPAGGAIEAVEAAGANGLPPASPGWSMSADGWALTAPNGRAVSLTASERLLLACLFDNRNEVVSRNALVEAMGHRADYYLNHRLDMLVSRLRSKVQKESGVSLPLRAVRGMGFMLTSAA